MFNKIRYGWDCGGGVFSGRKDGLTGIMIFTSRYYIFIKHEVVYEYNENNLCDSGRTYSSEYRTFGMNARKSCRKFYRTVTNAIEFVDALVGES